MEIKHLEQLRLSRYAKNILLCCTICQLFKSIPVLKFFVFPTFRYAVVTRLSLSFSLSSRINSSNKRLQQLARRKYVYPVVEPTCPIASWEIFVAASSDLF